MKRKKTISGTTRVKPFLKWIGGKSHLVAYLLTNIPKEYDTYWEPFLGSGSLFFALRPKRAVLADSNGELISCYKHVRNNPVEVQDYLEYYSKKLNEYNYYNIRIKYNNITKSAEKAAIFIYLNKTCFNGIWRVNKKGEFNVPFGKKLKPSFPTPDVINNASKMLKNAKLIEGDFRSIVQNATKGDFIYFDPPYPPLNKTSNFTHYTKERFLPKDQEDLAMYVHSLNKKGCKVLLSNTNISYIRELYKEYNIREREVTRWISANGQRYKVGEILISNY